jgi:site-specific DNA-methyltransferase (adenine-specific)
MLELNKIYCIDNIQGMTKLGKETVDLTVTSPPYDNIREYKGFSFDFERTARGLYYVTKQGGAVVWIVGDATKDGSETGTSFKQALYFKEIGFKLYDTMIYHKINPIPKNHRRYEQAFEYMFILTKGIPKTFNAILEQSKSAGKINRGTMRNSGKDELQRKHGEGLPHKETKIKQNVWDYAVGRCVAEEQFVFEHPAIFPEQLSQDHILSWSNEGDLVLDPFMGSGTTAKMAKLNNRNFIGFDISQEYVDIANKRIEFTP